MGVIRDNYQVWTEWLTIPRVALELAVSINTVHEWTRRKDDPLPVLLPPGNKAQGRVYRPQLNEWILRNFVKKGEQR